MATERNPDGTVVDYFAQHANKPAPTFISPPGAAAAKKKTSARGFCAERTHEKRPR
jgi:hypothetical protein